MPKAVIIAIVVIGVMAAALLGFAMYKRFLAPVAPPEPAQENISESIAESVPEPEPPPAPPEPEPEIIEPDDEWHEPEQPLLVNANNAVPADYLPELEKLESGYYLEAKASQALGAMTMAAQEAGFKLPVLSAYRSTQRQTEIYEGKIQEYLDAGVEEAQAIALTREYIAVPGTSEHALGLAVDLCSLYESFEDTPEFTWLVENCAQYGFILRYAKDKVDVTGFKYEPWHYRYVGSNHAQVIMERGICLEEYVAELS